MRPILPDIFARTPPTRAFFLAQKGPERRPERFNSIRVNRAKLPGALVTGIRILALALIVLAILLLGADLLATLEKAGELTVHSTAQDWESIDAASLDTVEDWAGHWHLRPALVSFLRLPGWGVSGVLGVLLLFCSNARMKIRFKTQ